MTDENNRLVPACSAVRNVVRFTVVALPTILCMCCTYGAAPLLSGEWESTLVIEPPAESWSTETDLTVEATFADYLTTAHSVFEDGAWKKQEFGVEATLGEFSIESDLRFEPYKDRFKDWITKIEWEVNTLALTLTTKLTRTTDWLIGEIEQDGEALEIAASVRFRSPSGSCASAFYDASVDLSFGWCGIETDLEVTIDDDGFDELAVKLSEVAVAKIPWLTFDLDITRTVETTSIKLSPDAILTSFWGCGSCELEIEGGFPDSPSLHPLAITETVLTWAMGNWEIEATAILDPSNWISKTYWLECQADAEFDFGDCGELSLELAFLWTETTLGRSRFLMTYEPSEAFMIVLESDFNLLNRELDLLVLQLGIEW